MLGLFPKLTVLHTGRDIEGQIYMPEVNYTLMVLTIAVTAGFKSTHQLGEAYGEQLQQLFQAQHSQCLRQSWVYTSAGWLPCWHWLCCTNEPQCRVSHPHCTVRGVC